MAVDKLVDSEALDSQLEIIADSIRAKGGTSAPLAFPQGFKSAIDAISTGGGGGVDLAGVEAYIANYLFETPTIVKGALNSYRGYISGI